MRTKFALHSVIFHRLPEPGGLHDLAIFANACSTACQTSFAQWIRAKSCDSFGPFGPVVATDLDWSQLVIRTLVNGRERQNYPAADMILPPAAIVSLISRELTLMPGDVISCGTSLGALPTSMPW